MIEACGRDQDELEVRQLGEGVLGEGDFVGDEDLCSGGVIAKLVSGSGVVKSKTSVGFKGRKIKVTPMEGGGVEKGDLHAP